MKKQTFLSVTQETHNLYSFRLINTNNHLCRIYLHIHKSPPRTLQIIIVIYFVNVHIFVECVFLFTCFSFKPLMPFVHVCNQPIKHKCTVQWISVYRLRICSNRGHLTLVTRNILQCIHYFFCIYLFFFVVFFFFFFSSSSIAIQQKKNLVCINVAVRWYCWFVFNKILFFLICCFYRKCGKWLLLSSRVSKPRSVSLVCALSTLYFTWHD